MQKILKKLTRQQLDSLEAIREAACKITTGPNRDSRPHPGMAGVVQPWLLDREQQQALAEHPADGFYLLAAACLFAWGYEDRQGKRNGNNGALTGIMAKIVADNIVTREQAAVISRVCQLAGKDGSLGEFDTPGVEFVQGNPVNVELLAAVIRLARELDLASQGTVDLIHTRAPNREGISREDFRGSYDVVAAGPNAFVSGTIQVSIACRHPEAHRLLKHHERYVQGLLQQYNGVVRPRFLYADNVFDIEARGYEPLDMKFSVDSSAALQLFTGNRLYADKRVFLRELIQNAVDACSFRQAVDDGFQPEIAILFNRDISSVTVQDNGIGMDRQWLEKYFLNIGISFYRSGEVSSLQRRSPLDFSFISQFGIGFLSSFLVSEKIVIRTRKRGSRGLRIAISDVKDYFDVRFIDDDCPLGTEVCLHLKPSAIKFCRSLEYAGYLKTHIRFLRYPVKMVDERGRESLLGCEPLAYDPGGAMDPVFTAALKFEDSEGYLQLKAKDHMGELYALESARGGISIFQDGIFVTQTDSLLPEGARQNVVGRINLRGRERCELSMDRNRIFWTEQEQHAIRRAVRHGLVEVVNALAASMSAQDLAANTRRSLINHAAVFFDFNAFDDEMHRALCAPVREKVEKRFRDFVRVHYAHTLRRRGISEASEYAEAWQQSILEKFIAKP